MASDRTHSVLAVQSTGWGITSENSARMPRDPVRVFTHRDVTGTLQPGVQNITVGHPLCSPPNPPCEGGQHRGFAVLFDQSVHLAPIFEAARMWQRPSPDEAELLLSMATLPAPPLKPFSTADLAAIKRLPRLEEDAHCSECAGIRYALRTMCKAAQALPDAKMNASLLRRHFSLQVRGSGLGYSWPGASGLLNGCEGTCSGKYSLHLVWDLVFGPGLPGFELEDCNGAARLQIPVISNIRWSWELEARTPPPWRSAHEHPERRDLLMSFAGSGNTAFKRFLLQLCPHVSPADPLQPGPNQCRGLDMGELQAPRWWDEPGKQALPGEPTGIESLLTARRIMDLKARSVFCLEPPGRNPGRKSMIDALLSGCIPVFFVKGAKEAQQRNVVRLPIFDAMLPLHFWWKRFASVLLDPDEVLQGKLDLTAHLHALRRSGRVARMQEAIARHGHLLMYSLDGKYPDATHALLRGLRDLLKPGQGAQCRRVLGVNQAWRCMD